MTIWRFVDLIANPATAVWNANADESRYGLA
jgi:hypothetical protein